MDILMEEFEEALWACLGKRKADQEQMEVECKTDLGVKVMDLEANPEATAAVAAYQEAPDEEAAVKTIGALEDRCGDRHLPLGYRRKPKERVPAEVGRHPWIFDPPSRFNGQEENGRAVKAGSGARWQLRLRKERIFGRIFRKAVELEIEKRIVGSSTGLQEVSDWTVWRCRSPPTSVAQPSEKRKWRYICRLFRTNKLKWGAMWHVDPLLGNAREISNNTTAVARQRSTNGSRGTVFYVWSVPRCYKQDKLGLAVIK
jgi:hypothetical protein